MAFGNITTLYYPTSANAGASQWGTDVRKLLSSADAGSDTTTITDHGTGGAVTRTHDPYSTSTADLAQADYGFAVTPSDMNSLTGARRFMAAGTHTLTASIRNNTSSIAKTNCRLDVFLYRIAATTRARTLIDSWSSAAFSTANLNAFVTVTASKSLAEIILGADETLQYSTELNASGTAATGETYTLGLGTNGGVATRVDHPKLGVLADAPFSSTGTATASGISGKVLGAVAASTGAATTSMAGASTASGVYSATGVAATSIAGASTASGVFNAAGVATPSILGSKVLGAVFACDIGGGAPAPTRELSVGTMD